MTKNEIIEQILITQQKYHTPTASIARDCGIHRNILSMILNNSVDRNINDNVYESLEKWLKERKV